MIKHIFSATLFLLGLCASSNPTWLINSNIKCDQKTLVNTATSSGQSYPFSFPSAFSTSSPVCIPGIVDFSLGTSTNRYFGISVQISNLIASSYQFNVVYYDSTSINSLKVTSLCFDNTVITYLSIASSFASYSFFDSLYSGSGVRESSIYVPFATGAINLSHKVHIIPLLTAFQLDRGSPATFFSIGVALEIVDANGYNRIYRTTGTKSVQYVRNSRIIYDQTVVQSTQQTYIDMQFMVGINSVPGTFSPFIYSAPQNSFAGISNFSFSDSQVPEFSFTLSTFTLSSPDYIFLNISTINYRYRVCTAPIIYYMQAQNLCYDICSAGFYAETVNYFCIRCFSGCLSCTDSQQSSCTSCNTTANRVLTSNACPCSPGYFDVGVLQCSTCSQVCLTCSILSTNCTSCGGNRLPSGTTCICPSNSYTDTGAASCVTCESMMLGCLTCSSSSVCLSCNSSEFRTLNGSICSCSAGYFDENIALCSSCSAAIVGCLACSSATACTSCDNSINRHLSSGACLCDSGYTQNGGVCVTCGSILLGCLQCSSNTACTSCNSSSFRVLNGSDCSCSSGYFDQNVQMCSSCSAAIVGCLACSSATACSSCNGALNRYLSGGLCPCSSGYTQNGGVCVTCGSLIFGCLTCTSTSVCTLCDSTLMLELNGTICSCQQSFYQQLGVCVSCGTGCLDCTSNSLCLTCKIGFYPEASVCKEICGDGILFTLDCDDGNLEDGDGCSSTCTVQVNYTCKDGSPTTPSKCSYNKPFDLELIQSDKDLSANAVIFKISVKPALKVLNQFDFSQIISSNISTQSMDASYQNGIVTVRIVYKESIQFLNVSITLNPPTSLNNTFAMLPSATTFTVNPLNSEAFFCNQNQYEYAKSIRTILQVSFGITYTALAIGLFFWKTVALETIHIMQMLFFCMSLMSSFLPMLIPITEIGDMVNGYNGLFRDNTNLLSFDEPILPKMLIQMKIGARFIQNCNYMILLQFLVIVIVGIFFILSYLNKCILKVCQFLIGQTLLYFVIFNTMNVGYSFNVHMLYFNEPHPQPSANQAACLTSAIVTLVITAGSCYMVIAKSHYFDRSNKIFKENSFAKMHPAIMCCYRLIVGVILGAAFQFKYIGVILLLMQICYLAYICWRRPYRRRIIFGRAILNELTIILIISEAFGYSLAFSPSVQSDCNGPTGFIWLEIILIFLAVSFNLGCILFGIYKEFRKKEQPTVTPVQNTSLNTFSMNQLKLEEQSRQVVKVLESPKRRGNSKNKQKKVRKVKTFNGQPQNV